MSRLTLQVIKAFALNKLARWSFFQYASTFLPQLERLDRQSATRISSDNRDEQKRTLSGSTLRCRRN